MAEGIEWEAVMKVFQDIEQWMSMGIKRVATALVKYAPCDIEFVTTPDEADLVIVHTVGDGQRSRWLNPDKPYAMIQYCLRTTELPNTAHWLPIWSRAKTVWSYYDLLSKIEEDLPDWKTDPNQPGTRAMMSTFNFYHAPLGVEKIFRPSMPTRKMYLIGTSGYVAETEGAIECYRVSRALDRMHFHLGPDLKLGVGIAYVTSIPDSTLADFWSQCTFVAGLRAIEGFELPVIEGLMCGARPICYDAPHYTHWFGEHAEYVKEGTSEELFESLMSIMSRPVRAVTPAERSQVAQKFDWSTLVTGFWEAVR